LINESENTKKGGACEEALKQFLSDKEVGEVLEEVGGCLVVLLCSGTLTGSAEKRERGGEEPKRGPNETSSNPPSNPRKSTAVLLKLLTYSYTLIRFCKARKSESGEADFSSSCKHSPATPPRPAEKL
jgi:hypothetical protein